MLGRVGVLEGRSAWLGLGLEGSAWESDLGNISCCWDITCTPADCHSVTDHLGVMVATVQVSAAPYFQAEA